MSDSHAYVRPEYAADCERDDDGVIYHCLSDLLVLEQLFSTAAGAVGSVDFMPRGKAKQNSFLLGLERRVRETRERLVAYHEHQIAESWKRPAAKTERAR